MASLIARPSFFRYRSHREIRNSRRSGLYSMRGAIWCCSLFSRRIATSVSPPTYRPHDRFSMDFDVAIHGSGARCMDNLVEIYKFTMKMTSQLHGAPPTRRASLLCTHRSVRRVWTTVHPARQTLLSSSQRQDQARRDHQRADLGIGQFLRLK